MVFTNWRMLSTTRQALPEQIPDNQTACFNLPAPHTHRIWYIRDLTTCITYRSGSHEEVQAIVCVGDGLLDDFARKCMGGSDGGGRGKKAKNDGREDLIRQTPQATRCEHIE